MPIERENKKGILPFILGSLGTIATIITIVCGIQTLLGLPGILNMSNLLNKNPQYKISTPRVNPITILKNEKKLLLMKQKLDMTKATWEKMKTDAIRQKIKAIEEESNNIENENQDIVAETNITIPIVQTSMRLNTENSGNVNVALSNQKDCELRNYGTQCFKNLSNNKAHVEVRRVGTVDLPNSQSFKHLDISPGEVECLNFIIPKQYETIISFPGISTGFSTDYKNIEILVEQCQTETYTIR
jgi:hypothetical protein